MTQVLDLVVVGAGPIGLISAISAARHGARKIVVIEQARALTRAGDNLRLPPNCLAAIESIDEGARNALRSFEASKRPERDAYYRTPDGKIASTIKRSTKVSAHIMWWRLQRLYVEHLPENVALLLNHQLVNITYAHDEADHATVEVAIGRKRENSFRNWDVDYGDEDGIKRCSQEDYSDFFSEVDVQDSDEEDDGLKRIRCNAKVVIGADGINSVTRKCIYRDCGPDWEEYADAMYTGIVRITTKSDATVPHEICSFIENTYLQKSEMTPITCYADDMSAESPRGLVAHLKSRGSFKPDHAWITMYFVCVDEQTAITSSSEELEGLANNSLLKFRFPEELIRLNEMLRERTKNHVIANRPMYIVPATHPPAYTPLSSAGDRNFPPGFQRAWGKRRAVIVGDAVHGGPPFLGQGNSMGVEDVCELMPRLARTGIWDDARGCMVREADLESAFEEYRGVRLERVCLFQKFLLNRLSEHDGEAMQTLREQLCDYKAPTDI